MIIKKFPKTRKSAQRERIWQIVAEDGGHPTAQKVYDRLRLESPRASLGNVYRNLRILAEEGRLAGNKFRDGSFHYDAVTEHHNHFICQHCHGVFDLELADDKRINELARRSSRHRIDSYTIQFFGICEACVSKKKNVRRFSSRRKKETITE
jgi:Fur family peroxide stress response transcriptional regulator